MVRVVLMKIVMPFSVKQYEKGLHFATANLLKKDAECGTGSHVLSRSIKHDYDFRLPDGSKPNTCLYSKKKFVSVDFPPRWIRQVDPDIVGDDLCKFVETTWDCFPYTKTRTVNGVDKDKVQIDSETMIIADDKSQQDRPRFIWDNPLLPNPPSFRGTSIKIIDITNKVFGMNVGDPTETRGRMSNIGPLKESSPERRWYRDYEKRASTVYKLTRVKFDVMLGTKIEDEFVRLLESRQYRLHKYIYCSMDSWWNLSLTQILMYEKLVYSALTQSTKMPTVPKSKKPSSAPIRLISIAMTKRKENRNDLKMTRSSSVKLPPNSTNSKAEERKSSDAGVKKNNRHRSVSVLGTPVNLTDRARSLL